RGTDIEQEHCAEAGQAHPPVRPVEQRLPKFGLKRPDRRADARLRQLQPLGGPTEMQRVRHREKAFELPQVHHAAPLRSGDPSSWTSSLAGPTSQTSIPEAEQ